MAIRRIRTINPNPLPAATLPSAADLDAIAEEERAKEATAPKDEASPLSTPPATPETPEQPSEPGFAPESAAGAPSFLPPNENVDWTDPNLDTTKKDSLGNLKSDLAEFGPRGAAPPPDVQTDAQRQAAADAREAKLREHMGSTVATDSTGLKKGRFAVTPQGHDEHGMRLPDKVDRTQVVEAQPEHVGPRGAGAPPDTFHGLRRVKK